MQRSILRLHCNAEQPIRTASGGTGTPAALERTVQSVVHRSPNMWRLIGLGTSAAFVYCVVATVAPVVFPASFVSMGRVSVYFEAAAVIISLTLLGQLLELKARSQCSAAIKSLLGLAPRTARRINADGAEEDVPPTHVHVGDSLRVWPGEKVPVDGVVLERQCEKHGIPWRRPSVFPRPATLPMKVAAAFAGDPGAGRRVSGRARPWRPGCPRCGVFGCPCGLRAVAREGALPGLHRQSVLCEAAQTRCSVSGSSVSIAMGAADGESAPAESLEHGRIVRKRDHGVIRAAPPAPPPRP